MLGLRLCTEEERRGVGRVGRLNERLLSPPVCWGRSCRGGQLGHEEGSCVMLAVMQGWLIQAWPWALARASTCPHLWGLGE